MFEYYKVNAYRWFSCTMLCIKVFFNDVKNQNPNHLLKKKNQNHLLKKKKKTQTICCAIYWGIYTFVCGAPHTCILCNWYVSEIIDDQFYPKKKKKKNDDWWISRSNCCLWWRYNIDLLKPRDRVKNNTVISLLVCSIHDDTAVYEQGTDTDS